jgi:hypothetical protein
VSAGQTNATESSATAAVRRAERYRSFPDCPHYSVGHNAELVYSPFTRRACTLSTVSAHLLQGCGYSATLEDHAARICREHNLAPAQWGAILAELSALTKAGLLVARTDLENHCRRHTEVQSASAPITTVGIPTRDRAPSLGHCVESYLESGRRHGWSNDYVIVDDSEEPQVRDGNRRTLQSLGARYGAAIFYAGPEDKVRFADALVSQCGLPREAVEFGLLNPEGCPIATGSSRNLLLLHAVGDVFLQVDDDTRCRLTPCPAAQPGLAFSSRYDPTEFWFLREDAPGAPEASAGADLLALHEQLLARSLSDCLAALGTGAEVDVDQTSAAFFRKLETVPGRVVVTAVGVVGDSGMGSSVGFLAREGDSRARLLQSERDYRRALASHQVMRAVTRPTICDAAYCMALNLGLDNRQLLPPFMPVQRNQDGIFAALVQSCVGNGFFGFLPWLLLHTPPTRRLASSNTDWKDAVRLRSGQMIQVLLRSIPLRRNLTNAAQNLRELGKGLTDIGSMPLMDFEETVRQQVWTQLSRQASQFAGQLQQFGSQPDYWANDVRQVLAAMAEDLPNECSAVPCDLAKGRDGRSASELFRCLVRRFGQLLQVWPDLVEAARDLRARGFRPANRI